MKVYIASKLKHAGKFKVLREQWCPEIDLHARWFDQATIELDGPELSPHDFHIFWLVDEEDVRIADALILYAEPGDHVRGALVETGIAIALGKLVIVVGDHPDYGTWQHHPTVTRAVDMEHARTMLLRRFHRGVPPKHSAVALLEATVEE